MSLKIIDRKIGTFIMNRDKLKTLGHEIALMIFDHAQAHGDCTRAIRLAAALPNSWQPQMEAWFKAFSPIRVVIKNNKCEFSGEYKKAPLAEKVTFWNREAANATPFYDLMDEPTVDKTYDFAALMEMASRLAKTIKKKIDDKLVIAEDVPTAEALVTALAGLKVERVKPANDQPLIVEKDKLPSTKGSGKTKTITLQGALAEVPAEVKAA